MNDTNDTNHYGGVLLEEMRDEIKAMHESMAVLAPMSRDVAQLKDDMVVVKDDIKIIKLAVKHQADDHSKLVKQVAKRWNKRLNN